MTKGKVLLGVLVGIAAGAALGVLFAPDKGANTRKNITRKGEDLADAINEKIEEKFDELTDTILGKSKNRTTQESSVTETKS
jgi:gas vesicle protein